jgi:hypothetical protein
MEKVILPAVAAQLAPIREAAKRDLTLQKVRLKHAIAADNWDAASAASAAISELEARLG